MKALLIAALLAFTWGDTRRISWLDAPSCVGSECAVEGTVVKVEDDGAAIRLYFDAERRDVCVTLVRSWLVSWPDYAGRSIVATGPVRRFHGLTEVTVLDPDEIEVAGAPPPVEFVAPEKEEVQELRDEIHRLEKRIDELESD